MIPTNVKNLSVAYSVRQSGILSLSLSVSHCGLIFKALSRTWLEELGEY
jgi:hypothetical protein